MPAPWNGKWSESFLMLRELLNPWRFVFLIGLTNVIHPWGRAVGAGL